MKKEILVNNGVRKRIKEVLGCSYPTIREALTYRTSTLLGQRIREVAIELGGVVYESVENQSINKRVQ